MYRLDDSTALVQTVDFFTPIVDDPYTYGAIAAANALSDIYAMGARPVTALAIAAFPEDLDPAVLNAVLRGGSDKVHEAGVNVIGGHTVKDAEPKYGLSVTGIVHPERIVRNSTARPGDALVLTKAIGTGILTTARRDDTIVDDAMTEAIASMLELNRGASEAMIDAGAHAATDVTGFGLIGHLREMLDGSGVGARLSYSSVPVLAHALELAAAGVVPGGTRTNAAQAIEAGVTFHGISEAMQYVLCDAQTSGGLLIAIAEDDVPAFEGAARGCGVSIVAKIGKITAERGLLVEP